MIPDTEIVSASQRLQRTGAALTLASQATQEALALLALVATYKTALANIYEHTAPQPAANVVPLKGVRTPRIEPEHQLSSIRQLCAEVLGIREEPAKGKKSGGGK
jgi:hypothetical protein